MRILKKLAIVFSLCATGYVLSTSSDSGKAAYSLILSAYLAGKPVVVIGTGACSGTTGLAEVLRVQFP